MRTAMIIAWVGLPLQFQKPGSCSALERLTRRISGRQQPDYLVFLKSLTEQKGPRGQSAPVVVYAPGVGYNGIDVIGREKQLGKSAHLSDRMQGPDAKCRGGKAACGRSFNGWEVALV